MAVVWTPWSQPVLTSDADYGEIIVSSVNAAGATPSAGYRASDGVMEGSATSWESAKTVVPSSWKWTLPHLLRISQIVLYNKYSGYDNVTRDVAVFADEAMTIPIGAAQTFEPVSFSTVTMTPDAPVETDTIFIVCSSSYGTATNMYVGLGEVVITAAYPVGQCEVNFVDWDGTVLKTEEVTPGGSATPPTAPYRNGHTFAGWDSPYDYISDNVSITAQYIELPLGAFEYYESLGSGHSPQAVHMMDNGLRIFFVGDDGLVRGLETFPALGLYDELSWAAKGQMSIDETVSHPKLKKIQHHGAYGFWSAMGDHRFVMYMLPTDVSKYFVKGTLTFTKDTSVSSGSFTLQNVKELLVTRNRSVLSPNAYLELYFSMGSSGEIMVGKWYIDKVTTTIPGNDLSVTARNGIGKYLKEQSFDEHTVWTEGGFTDNIKAILAYAAVESCFVGDALKDWKLQYDPDCTLLKGIEDLVKLLPFWKVEETLDGVIGVGHMDDARFDQPTVFRFVRDKNCWKYKTEYTDEATYTRLCIYCKEPELRLYYDLPVHKLWPMPRHRTLFAKVPDGTDESQMRTYANSLMEGIADSGRTETFYGRFTPHMVIGDQIELQNETDVEVVGTVTSIRHTVGTGGFSTEFTVDSGGRKGRLTLKDYVEQIGKGGTANCIIVEESPQEETPTV